MVHCNTFDNSEPQTKAHVFIKVCFLETIKNQRQVCWRNANTGITNAYFVRSAIRLPIFNSYAASFAVKFYSIMDEVEK